MARTRRIKKDSDAHYHLMSRTNDRRFLFESGEVKSELVSALRRAAEFCGVEIKAYAAMDNPFHVVVQIGAGVVFGDEAFVLATAFALGDRFHSGGAGAHPAGDVGWSTHGWRLAAATRRISSRNKAQARQK